MTRLLQAWRGNALAEFALTAPLYFLMLWSSVDVARLEMGQIQLRMKGHALARFISASTQKWNGELEIEARNWAFIHHLNLTTLHVISDPISLNQTMVSGRLIRRAELLHIELKSPFLPISPLLMALKTKYDLGNVVLLKEIHVYDDDSF